MSHAENVLQALERAIQEHVTESPGVMFSGGIDSTILAHMLARHTPPRLFTVGVEGSYDLRVGEETAGWLGLEWQGIVVDEGDLLEAIRGMTSILPTTNPVTLSFEMPFYLVASRVSERHLYSGQGADELFAGYARYMEMDMEERERAVRSDLAHLLDQGLSFETEIANSLGKELHYPYLHPGVRETVARIPIEEEFRDPLRKSVLRDVASLLELDMVMNRKKKAAQYGSGIMKTLRSAAKARGKTVRALVRELSSE
ncbi:MAG: asparagine synthase C-terminal domain-containing protein [Methanomassiliicoccales archaeon]